MIPRWCIYLWCNRLREVVQSAVQDELECSGQVLPKVWNGVDCVEHCIERLLKQGCIYLQSQHQEEKVLPYIKCEAGWGYIKPCLKEAAAAKVRLLGGWKRI